MAEGKGSSTVILGGGFGGLTAANELRRQLGNEHRITLIDKTPQFFMGLAKLWVLAGRRRPEEGTGDLKLLEAKGIKFIESRATRIDASNKKVFTESGEYSFDYLVIALGADLSPGTIPGFTEGAQDFYTTDGADQLRERVDRLNEGKLCILISSTPFKCPSAPYEAAMLMDEMLRKKRVRDNVEIQIFTPEPHPLPAGGPVVGAQVETFLSERGIGFNPGTKVKEIDAVAKSISFENGTKARYDLLAGVPTHAVPNVVKDSGLAGPAGWIPVDKLTLKTSSADIYAVGDVASVMMANNSPMPKLGILAEEEAKVVARNIANDIQGIGMRSQFEGHGQCFIEVGGGKASMAFGQFMNEPAPKIVLDSPTVEALEMKREFEASRLATWF